jgi:hypothetical protein
MDVAEGFYDVYFPVCLGFACGLLLIREGNTVVA